MGVACGAILIVAAWQGTRGMEFGRLFRLPETPALGKAGYAMSMVGTIGELIESEELRGKKLPLLVHLHGTGGIGQDNLRPISDGGGVVRMFMDKKFQGYQETYIMIPQTAAMSGWYALSPTDPSYALRAIVHAIRLLAETPGYRIDLSRIYVTGLSMGGAGAFQAMAKFPGFFAAAIPISYVDTPKIFNEGNVGPMWVVINSGDRNYEERLRDFRKHYLAMGGSIRISVNHRMGHDAWTSLLGDHKFRNWLFRRQLEPD